MNRTLVSIGVISAAALSLVGCSAPEKMSPPATVITSASSSSMEALPPTPEVLPMKEITLVDQNYDGVASLKGAEWLRAIKTAKVSGDITSGELVVTLERGGDNTSWSAAGMYIARAGQTENGNSYPDETSFGKNLHFISAEWRGDCARHLSPSSSFGVLFGVLKEHTASLTVNLRDVVVAKGNDGCEKGQDHLDIIQMINDGGVYLGFAPSDRTVAPYMKVVLRYRGTLEVTNF